MWGKLGGKEKERVCVRERERERKETTFRKYLYHCEKILYCLIDLYKLLGHYQLLDLMEPPFPYKQELALLASKTRF